MSSHFADEYCCMRFGICCDFHHNISGSFALSTYNLKKQNVNKELLKLDAQHQLLISPSFAQMKRTAARPYIVNEHPNSANDNAIVWQNNND